MKKEKLSIFLLVAEIAAIITLHSTKGIDKSIGTSQVIKTPVTEGQIFQYKVDPQYLGAYNLTHTAYGIY